MNTSETLKRAQEAFQQKNASEALALLDQLLNSTHSSVDAPGYLLRGLIFEFGGDGVAIDLAKAIASYRVASNLIHNSDSIPFLYLARALMKQGQESYQSALKCIQEAGDLRHTPDVDLAYAYFYETAPEPNFEAAKKHYMNAALHGRFAGFFGYSAISRKAGNRFKAVVVDCIRVLLGPWLFIALGRKARSSFNGY